MLLAAELCIVVLAAVVQGVSGFGFAVVAVPLVAYLHGLDHAVALGGMLGLCASLNTVRTSRADIRWPIVGAILRGSMLGIPVGLLALHLVDTRRLTVTTGIAVLVVTAALAFGIQVRCTHPMAQSATGVVSGALGACTGMTGPPVVVGLQGAEIDASTMRATIAFTLGVSGAVILVMRALMGHVHLDVLPVVALGVPMVWLGNTAGQWIFGRVSGRTYSLVVTTLLGLSGVVALLPR